MPVRSGLDNYARNASFIKPHKILHRRQMKTESNGGDCSAVAAPASNGGRWRHELVPKLRLSPGHHFVVSDEELVDFYLRGKIEQRRPPMDFINEGYGENIWYFFTVRKPSKTKKQDKPNK
uniref:Uncharacterized protein n=1 Tax=Oryza glumipatula TaxID=40148 RepID=A0A0D9ZXX0_9ORYZ